MVQYKNDRALISLGSICNIANTQTNSIDGTVRLCKLEFTIFFFAFLKFFLLCLSSTYFSNGE